MSPVLRAGLLFALLSVAAMFLFSFTAADFTKLGPIGKVNVFVLPLLLLLGTLYDYRIVFDKAGGIVEIRNGFFFNTSKRFPLDEVQKLVVRVIHPGGTGSVDEFSSSGFRRGRAFVGFIIAGRLIVLDRACPLKRAKGWITAFRAFMPFAVEEGT